VSQEVFMRVHRGLPRFRGEAALETWIYRITCNAALNHRRRKRPREVLMEVDRSDPAPGPEAGLRSRELRDRLAETMRSLPPKQRAVLSLRLNQELPFHRIARIMGTHTGTAKANYFHAVRKLRTALEDLR